MKKKYLVALVVVLIVVVGAFASFKLLSKNSDNKNNGNGIVKEVEPASSTEELLTSSKEIANANVTKDKIEFDNSINLVSGEKIAIWLYSSPKFLGWFEIKEENGTKYIDGLEKAMEKENIDSGSHHIAIANEENETLGYISIDINEDNSIEEVDAIKELGIEQDFYTLSTFYETFHIHFNKDYTFSIDNNGVSVCPASVTENCDKYFFLTDKIDFKSGKYELIEKDNEHIMLKLTFYYKDGTSLEKKVAMHSGYDFGNEYVAEVMEMESIANNGKIVLLWNQKKDFLYFDLLLGEWAKYLK